MSEEKDNKEYQFVDVRYASIIPHPNADRLEIATIGGYQAIVQKGVFKNGELVGYIPEAALVPDVILRELNLYDDEKGKGKLSGSKGNRVKAIRLRGVFSQGLVIKAQPHWKDGDDVGEELNVEKYNPMKSFKGMNRGYILGGDKYHAGDIRTIKYNIENIKRYNDVLEEGEEVVFTEKLHGTWASFGLLSEELAHDVHGRKIVSSKGLSKKGIALKVNEENSKNTYVKMANDLNIWEKLEELSSRYNNQTVFVLGEIVGVQDLKYGLNDGECFFRVFDIYVGDPGKGEYLDFQHLNAYVELMGLERVPVLFVGTFNHEVMVDYTNGKESITGQSKHIREGIVIRPVNERKDYKLGRVQLKSISTAYSLRKHGTEYN
jgi:RNA ligase (TIGR02306 family)